MVLAEALKSAYAVGGAGAVLVVVLLWGIATLWKRLQQEHEERLKQARADTELLRELLEISLSNNVRRSLHGAEELMDYDDADEISTRLTFRMRDTVTNRAKAFIHSRRPLGRS